MVTKPKYSGILKEWKLFEEEHFHRRHLFWDQLFILKEFAVAASFLSTPIMADFPSKVTTETSAPHAQGSQQGGNGFLGMAANFTTMVDLSFIRSIPAILMMAEVVCTRPQAVLCILLLTVFILKLLLKLFSVPFCSEAKLLPSIFLFCPVSVSTWFLKPLVDSFTVYHIFLFHSVRQDQFDHSPSRTFTLPYLICRSQA